MGDIPEFSEPLMDFDSNLPEMLAVDLEQSLQIFESRHLTAGPPAPGLSGNGSIQQHQQQQQQQKRRYSLQHDRLAPFSPSYLSAKPALTSSKSLQSIHQQYYSDVFAPLDRDYAKRPSSSGSDDGSAFFLEPPSVSTRAHSLLTIDTSSVDSPTTSHINHSENNQSPQQSWINFDMDDEISPAIAMHQEGLPSHDTLHAGDITDITNKVKVTVPSEAQFPKEQIQIRIAQDEPALNFPLSLPPRRSSLQYQEAYLGFKLAQQLREQQARSEQPSPIAHTQIFVNGNKATDNNTDDSVFLDDCEISPTMKLFTEKYSPWLEQASSDADVNPDNHTHRVGDEKPTKAGERSPTTQSFHEVPIPAYLPRKFQERAVKEDANGKKDKGEPVPIIFNGEVEVEGWLQSNSQHEFEMRRSGRLTPISLSASTLETLRITISCFPETILVSNSLTTETIRAAAQSIHYAAADRLSQTLLGEENGDHLNGNQKPQSRLSKWKLPGTLSQLLTRPSSSRSHRRDAEKEPFNMENDNLPSTTGKPAWATIKAIFPLGTDYLCDSLYAHILAFNYVTALCPRAALITPDAASLDSLPTRPPPQPQHMPPPPPRDASWRRHDTPREARRPGSAASSTFSIASDKSSAGQSYITVGAPKKAASILGIGDGLSAASRPTTAATNYNDQRPESSGRRASLARHRSSLDHRVSDGCDSLRDLRLGLARCIAQIVATMRLAGTFAGGAGAGGEGDGEGMDSVKGPVEDPMFMQALCEVVRVSEMH